MVYRDGLTNNGKRMNHKVIIRRMQYVKASKLSCNYPAKRHKSWKNRRISKKYANIIL